MHILQQIKPFKLRKPNYNTLHGPYMTWYGEKHRPHGKSLKIHPQFPMRQKSFILNSTLITKEKEANHQQEQ